MRDLTTKYLALKQLTEAVDRYCRCYGLPSDADRVTVEVAFEEAIHDVETASRRFVEACKTERWMAALSRKDNTEYALRDTAQLATEALIGSK